MKNNNILKLVAAAYSVSSAMGQLSANSANNSLLDVDQLSANSANNSSSDSLDNNGIPMNVVCIGLSAVAVGFCCVVVAMLNSLRGQSLETLLNPPVSTAQNTPCHSENWPDNQQVNQQRVLEAGQLPEFSRLQQMIHDRRDIEFGVRSRNVERSFSNVLTRRRSERSITEGSEPMLGAIHPDHEVRPSRSPSPSDARSESGQFSAIVDR